MYAGFAFVGKPFLAPGANFPTRFGLASRRPRPYIVTRDVDALGWVDRGTT
jgi:hypothetical protein